MKFNFFFILVALFFNSCSGRKSPLPTLKAPRIMTKSVDTTATSKLAPVATGVQIPQALKLIIGAGGIYSAFLYYGTLQEDVFHYKSVDGTKFKEAWFLQALGKAAAKSRNDKLSNLSFKLRRGSC